jgi:hypothetical protein
MKKIHRKRFPHNSKIPKVEVFQQITTFAVRIQEKTDIYKTGKKAGRE